MALERRVRARRTALAARSLCSLLSLPAHPLAASSLAATADTEELDWTNRYLLWIGVPVGYLLLSCCCCCTLCVCAAGGSGKRAGGERLSEMDLADLANAQREVGDDEVVPA